jgi:hypothetical protein
MHYVTNDWELGNICGCLRIFQCADYLLLIAEELLIDFRDIIGEHSGANMAHTVYETLCSFGLKGRVSQQI